MAGTLSANGSAFPSSLSALGLRTQLVVIVEILIAQGQPVHPLADQLLHRVLDPIRVAMIRETGGKLPDGDRRPQSPAIPS